MIFPLKHSQPLVHVVAAAGVAKRTQSMGAGEEQGHPAKSILPWQWAGLDDRIRLFHF